MGCDAATVGSCFVLPAFQDHNIHSGTMTNVTNKTNVRTSPCRTMTIGTPTHRMVGSLRRAVLVKLFWHISMLPLVFCQSSLQSLCSVREILKPRKMRKGWTPPNGPMCLQLHDSVQNLFFEMWSAGTSSDA